VIEKAIVRGQGRSLDGSSLESVTLEAMMPPGVALMIDVETDNRARSLKDLRLAVKKAGGTHASGSTAFFFTRLGRVVFAAAAAATAGDKGGRTTASLDDVLDRAIDAGAEDVDADADGNTVVWTPPSLTTAVVEAVAAPLGLPVLSSAIVWSPNEDTKVRVEDVEAVRNLGALLVKLREFPEVQAVYANAVRGDTVSDEDWAVVEENLDL
jgi:transcriptional/translational regulatory protein YebC/TACO1